MARKPKDFDKLKVIKSLSRKEFGRPGHGRKTSYTDRKKKSDRLACRTNNKEE